MRKLLVLALVVMALASVAGIASAEPGGELPPLRMMSTWRGVAR